MNPRYTPRCQPGLDARKKSWNWTFNIAEPPHCHDPTFEQTRIAAAPKAGADEVESLARNLESSMFSHAGIEAVRCYRTKYRGSIRFHRGRGLQPWLLGDNQGAWAEGADANLTIDRLPLQ